MQRQTPPAAAARGRDVESGAADNTRRTRLWSYLTLASQDKESEDPSRVGAAANPLLAGGGLSTGIAKVPGGACGVSPCVVGLVALGGQPHTACPSELTAVGDCGWS
jgi:hypothetical protein